MDERFDAPGWQAIDRLLVSRYPGQVPHQFTSTAPYEPSSPSPLPAVTAFESQRSAGWHLVTYGLSELFEKSSPNLGISGFGFELTLHVARGEDEARPPTWAVRFLQAVGRMQLDARGSLDTGTASIWAAGSKDPPSRALLVCPISDWADLIRSMDQCCFCASWG